MIKRLFVILTAIFLLVPQLAVYADVIMGNDFQARNKDAMQKLDRTRFCVNGPDGYVIPQEEPGSTKGIPTGASGLKADDVLKYQNGEELPIDCTYIYKGEYWGVIAPNHYIWSPGWIPMKNLLVVYVASDFEKENEDKFYTYTGSYDKVLAAEKIVLWTWPGSDREKRVVDDERYTLQSVDTRHAYKDNEGREWGYVRLNYDVSYAQEEGWICFTDPSNSDIPAFNPAPKPIKWSPDGIFEWTHIPPIAAEEQNSLSNIKKIRTYEPNETFTDVAETAWYHDAVAAAYEYGIFEDAGIRNTFVLSEIDDNGNTIYNDQAPNKFNPNISLSETEALVIAARLHAHYKYGQEKGDSILEAYSYAYARGGPSAGYPTGIIEYCRIEGLADSGDNSFSRFNRAKLVHAWGKILQMKDMQKQNTVISLPDVTADTPYFEDIILFYETGIIGGVDANGSFNPNGRVTRAEAAAIFMNIIDVNKRYSGRTYGSAH